MAIEDYTNPQVSEKDQKPSGLQAFIKEHRLGLWIPAGFFALGVTIASLPSNSWDDVRDVRQPGEIRHKPKETIIQNMPHIDFNLYRTNEGWTGMKITIDRMLIDDWARYAPVSILIPELKYAAQFPVENGCKSAETTFPRPAPTSQTYTYMILGLDPLTKKPKELYKQVLSPEK